MPAACLLASQQPRPALLLRLIQGGWRRDKELYEEGRRGFDLSPPLFLSYFCFRYPVLAGLHAEVSGCRGAGVFEPLARSLDQPYGINLGNSCCGACFVVVVSALYRAVQPARFRAAS